MGENNNCGSNCLVGVMDHLWFHQLILLSSSSSSLFFSKPLKQDQVAAAVSESSPSSSSLSSSAYSSISSNNSQTPTSLLSEEEINPLNLALQLSRLQDDESFNYKQDMIMKEKETTHERERPTRKLKHNIATKSSGRFHSSSPSNQKRSRKQLLRIRNEMGYLQKTMSCKSLCELELEEVKGFMDLGFKFSKESLSKRMMSVIPGLQRLELYKSTGHIDDHAAFEDDKDDDEANRCRIIRPYLSEAWLIKRADSPLLNLRPIPRVSTAAEMKKHLKYWARTVASAIHQRS